MAAFIPLEQYEAPQATGAESLGSSPDAATRAPLSLFKEDISARARRLALGAAYALRPGRLSLLPHLWAMTGTYLMSPALAKRRLLAPTYHGWQGLAGVSEDLSPNALMDAYRRGLFPFCHIRPMKWWSPDVRAVIRPDETHIPKNLARLLRQRKYRVTFDTDFAAVIRTCAEPRSGKTPLTWVTPQVMKAYWDLHQAGHAHSVEVWDRDGQLVGGLYGVATGGVFFGESQFSTVRDTSKIAGTVLNMHLAHWGFALRDAKWLTEHLAQLGFHTMGRAEFLQVLEEHAWKPGRVGRWSVDPTLDAGTWRTNT